MLIADKGTKLVVADISNMRKCPTYNTHGDGEAYERVLLDIIPLPSKILANLGGT